MRKTDFGGVDQYITDYLSTNWINVVHGNHMRYYHCSQMVNKLLSPEYATLDFEDLLPEASICKYSQLDQGLLCLCTNPELSKNESAQLECLEGKQRTG